MTAPPPRPPRPSRRAAAPPAAPARAGAPVAELTPAERTRVRRLVRYALGAVVAVQALILAVTYIPAVRAQVAVIDAALINVTRSGLTQVNSSVNNRLNTTNSRLQTANDYWQQHSRQQSGQTTTGTSEVDAVTKTATQKLTDVSGSLSFASSGAVGEMQRLMPGTVPWTDYHANYKESADAALATLRGGMAALAEHNRSIEDATRLTRLSDQARNSESLLGLSQLQVQSQIEVARQLQALRAQQALHTSLYAVAESHNIGVEARHRAKDKKDNCDILAQVLGGVPGAAAAALCVP